MQNHEIYTNYILENALDFIKTNTVPLITMVSGIALGQSETHRTLGEYLTDPVTIGLIKDYMSIFLSLGGFIVILYNTFRKRKK